VNHILWTLIFYSALVQSPSILLTLLKSRLFDVTEISISNMLNIQWLWIHKWCALAVVVIVVPWLISIFMTAPLAKKLS